MLIDSYKQESNYKREYKLINVNEGIDLIPFIDDGNLSYSKFEQEKDGSMSANSMSFTLTFPYNMIVIDSVLDILYIDDSVLTDLYIDDSSLTNLEQPLIVKKMSLDTIVKKGDNISFIETTENCKTVFEGIVESVKLKRDNISAYLSIEVKDRTYSLYEMKHLKEEFFQDVYLCSTSNKNNSLIHQVAYRLGFKDEELDLPDFTTIIPFVLFKKDELIIKDLAYAVRLVGGVFTIENGKLVVRGEANRVTDTYVFDSRNILSEININPIYPNYDKLKITYDYYFEKAKQDMWILVGKNGNLNDANIVVRAGQDRKFSVDWLYNVDLVKESELYEVVFTKADGTIIDFQYSLNIDETGGTLELDNTNNNYDVYVKKFKIRGIPLFMQSGNESYYPANVESEKLLDNLENKLAQNSDLALLYLKANYNENCKAYKSISFSTNINNYLEPCRKIYLNHADFIGYIIIEKIDFQGTKMSIQAREYLEPVNLNDIKTLEKSNVDELEVISNKFLTEKGLYEADLPLAPQNLLLISQALGFTITFDNFSSNLRGHFVYLKKKTDVDWMKFFIDTNNYFYQTTNLVTYEIKVSSVSINGKEGETTEVKEVTPILLNNEVVDYPKGLSPSELNDMITINKSDIIALKQIDDSHYSLIMQNKSEIILAVREDEIITAINLSAEGINIHGSRIALGSGLVVENGFVAVRELGAENIRAGSITAEHIAGKKLEGLEIVSENIEKTERVLMNYGKVIHQKRNTVLEDYKTYDQLIMHVTGEVSCPKAWSNYIDLKSYNNNQAWSSLNLICFVGNQYELDAGIATSREIIKEWYNNDPTTQKVKFKVCGNANVTTDTSMVGKPLKTSSSIIVPSTSIVNFGITVTAHVQTTSVGGSIGNIYNRSRTIVYVQFDNEAEQILIDIPQDTSVQKSGGTYEGLLMTKTASLYKDFLTNVKTFKLRVVSYYYFSQSGNTYYGEPAITFTGSYTTMNFVQDKLFDATVNWLAIGNS